MSNRSFSMVILVFIACFVVLFVLPGYAAEHDMHKVSRYDIVTTAEKAGNLNTFVAAVQAAGLEGLMREQNSYTVFAPTDEAFSRLPEGTLENLLLPENRDVLRNILTYHVVINKRIVSSRLQGVHQLRMVNGELLDISFSPGKVMAGRAAVIMPDITTKNGIVHVIDMVLLP